MTDSDLTALLAAAFLPYAKGFADDKNAVRLTVSCSTYQVEGTLTLSAADYAVLHQGAHTEVDVERAFRMLSSWNDERTPSLVIESA